MRGSTVLSTPTISYFSSYNVILVLAFTISLVSLHTAVCAERRPNVFFSWKLKLGYNDVGESVENNIEPVHDIQ